MTSPASPGLADRSARTLRRPRPRRSASPTRYRSDKTSLSKRRLSLDSDTSPISSTVTLYLEASRPTVFLTQQNATTDGPARPGRPSEAPGGVDRPAAQPAARRGNRVRRAERAKRATTSRRGCQRATAASSPDRSAGANRGPHDVDQPAATACGRPGSPSAQADRREASPQRRRLL